MKKMDLIAYMNFNNKISVKLLRNDEGVLTGDRGPFIVRHGGVD